MRLPPRGSPSARIPGPVLLRAVLPLLVLPLLVLLLLVLLGAAVAVAQEAPVAAPADTYDDPLALTRVDEEAQDLSIAVELRNTGEVRRAAGRQLLQGSQEMYLRSAVMAVVFQAGRQWQAPLQRLTIQVRDASFEVVAGSRLVVTDRQQILLPVPVLAADGDLWLPMTFVTEVLGRRLRQTMRWDPDQRRLSAGSAVYTVTGLRVEPLTRATALHINCREPFGYRAAGEEPGFLTVTIYGGEVDPAAVSLGRARARVTSVVSGLESANALVVIGLDDLVGRYRTYTRNEGREIVVVLEEEEVAALPEPVPRGRARVAISPVPVDVTRVLEIRTVVIDPGHGGDDVGAVGVNDIREKNVNLAVARRLRRFLERESDLDVVLTREDDVQLDLSARAEVANAAGGHLLLSLHCNSWFDSGASGLETYFLSPAQSDWSKSVEAAENQAGGEEAGDVEFIVWELVQNRFISSSSDLAEVVQRHVCESLGLPNRGVRQAGFRVLVGAYMPAVLVELGFLSHPEEERRLNDGGYQDRLARALGEAVLAYRDQAARTAATVQQGSATDGVGREDGR